jgi:hypothetical protein
MSNLIKWYPLINFFIYSNIMSNLIKWYPRLEYIGQEMLTILTK